MKFKADAKNLREKLSTIAKAATVLEPGKQMVLVGLDEGQLVLRSFGDGTFCQEAMRIIPEDDRGRCLVRLAPLLEFVGHLSGEIEVSLSGNRMLVETEDLEGFLTSEPAGRAHNEPFLDELSWVSTGLASCISYPATEKDRAVHFIGNLSVSLSQGGYRFASLQVESDFIRAGESALPGKFVGLLPGSEIAITENKIWLRRESMLAFVPVWSQLLPDMVPKGIMAYRQNGPLGFIVSASEMIRNLRALKYFSSPPDSYGMSFVKIVSDDNGVVFLSPASEVGSGSYRPEAKQLSHFQINTNLGYLIDALMNVSQDEVVILVDELFEGGARPLIIRPVDESVRELHGIWPIHDQAFQAAKEKLDAADKPRET